jgi:hypothetical protein
LVAKQSKYIENATTIQKAASLEASFLIHEFGFWGFISTQLIIGRK